MSRFKLICAYIYVLYVKTWRYLNGFTSVFVCFFIVLRMIYVYGNDYFWKLCCDMIPSAV